VSRDAKVRERLARDEVPAALDVLRNDDCRTVDCLLQRGHLAYLAGDYDQTQRDLAAAESLIQDLWTLSLSREAATLVVSDNTTAYSGEPFERVWLNFVRALAYLAGGEPWEAAVEGRAISRKLDVLASEGDDEKDAFNDPFLQYFAGMLAEADGEINRAWIDYRKAERLYRATEVYGVQAPPDLDADLLRMAEKLSFPEEAEEYRWRSGGIEPLAPGEGELVLLVSQGLIPGKRTERIDFPIFKDEEDDDPDALRLAVHSYGHWRAGTGELDYWVSVALPALDPVTEAPELRWSSSTGAGPMALAADLGHLQRSSFEREYSKVAIRAVARALIKYWGTQKLEEKGGRGWGILANIFGAATEWADTRGWATLPERVYVARLRLPAGEQPIKVGSAHGKAYVPEGGTAFLHLRLD